MSRTSEVCHPPTKTDLIKMSEVIHPNENEGRDGGLRTTPLFATALGLMENAERCLAEAKKRFTDDQKFIGQCMRLEREKRKVSLRALSRQMWVSAPYVSDLELGRRLWSTATISNYSQALDALANAEHSNSHPDKMP